MDTFRISPGANGFTGQPTQQCNGRLHFFGTGSASLSGRSVQCDCGKRRDLSGILNNSMVPSADGQSRTTLSAKLSNDGTPYLCKGLRPWLGEKDGQGCGLSLFGTLRGATNVYFPIVRSSIYLPLQEQGIPAELTSILDEDRVRINLETIKRFMPDATPEVLREELKTSFLGIFDKFLDEDVDRGIREIELGETAQLRIELLGDEPETSFRRAEYEVLTAELNHEELVVKPADISRYEAPVSEYFSKVQLIKTLRETRVFTGFSRLNSRESLSQGRAVITALEKPELPRH